MVPDARLVAVLRDPVERAHSNWSHLRGADLEPEADFLRALELEQQRIDDGWAHFWHYAAQGRYGEQLDHLFTLFPREQVLLLRYAELRNTPVAAADKVCRFLGVETGHIADVGRRNVRHDVSGRSEWPAPQERAAAVHRFVDDMPRVEHWTGWDLSAWIAARPAGQ